MMTLKTLRCLLSLERIQKVRTKNLETFVLFIGSAGDLKNQILNTKFQLKFLVLSKDNKNFGRRCSFWFLVNSFWVVNIIVSWFIATFYSMTKFNEYCLGEEGSDDENEWSDEDGGEDSIRDDVSDYKYLKQRNNKHKFKEEP